MVFNEKAYKYLYLYAFSLNGGFNLQVHHAKYGSCALYKKY